MKTKKDFTLYAVIAILLIICLVQAKELKEYGQPKIIRHSVSNGLHTIDFVTIDTLELNDVDSTAYAHIVKDGILPNHND